MHFMKVLKACILGFVNGSLMAMNGVLLVVWVAVVIRFSIY